MNKKVACVRAVYPYVGLCGAMALIVALQAVVPLTVFSRRLLAVGGSALLVYVVSAFVLKRYQEALARLPGTTVWSRADRVCQYASENHIALTACALVPSMFLLYGSSLFFSFMSDDFGYLWLFHVQKLRVFLPFMHQGTYHYVPVGLVLCGLPSLLVGFHPLLFHAECLVIHLVNCLLVYWLCFRSTKNKLVSLAACALFFAYFFHYEAVFWVTGIFNSAMTLFCLTAFLCFARYLEEPRALLYAGFLLFFALAMLTMEIASVLVLLCPIYEFLQRPPVHGGLTTASARVTDSVRRFKKYIAPALILALNVGTKSLYGIAMTNMDVTSWREARLLKQLLFSTLYLIMPNNVMGVRPIDLTTANVFVVVVLFGALTLYVFWKGSFHLRFFFLWGLLTMSVAEVMTAGMAARYFYLPVAGFSLFLVILLYDLCRWVGRLLGRYAFGEDVLPTHLQLRSVVRLAENSAFVLLVCVIVLKGAAFIKAKETEWHKTSTIVTNVLRDIKLIFPEAPLDKEVYFVNIPGYLTRGADSPAFFYRSGFIAALHMMRGEPFARRIYFSHTRDHFYPVVGSETPTASYRELRELSLRPDVAVVLFDPETDSLVRLQGDDT